MVEEIKYESLLIDGQSKAMFRNILTSFDGKSTDEVAFLQISQKENDKNIINIW